MHWLPLVAMVIASALPFPHSPVSRIVAASTEPGPRIDSRGEDHNVSASHLAAPAQPPVDYNLLLRKASQMDYNMAAARGEDAREQSRSAMHNKDYVKTSVHEGLSTFKGKSQESFQVNTNSDSGNMNEISLDVHVPTGEGKLRTSNNNSQKDSVSTDNSVAEDYQTHSHSRRKDMNYADFAVGDKLRSSLYSGTIEKNDIGPLQVSGGGAHSAASHAASLPNGKGPQSPVPLEQSSGSTEQGSNVNRGEGSHGSPEIGLGQEQSQERQGMEAGLGLGLGVDGIPKGDEMLFLDAHPRVLFSPSPLPPKHPPLLLMLETGVLQEDGEDEEEDEADRYIEGHGDRAIDRSGLPMGTDDLGGGSEPVQHIKRNKRSHMTEARRGERSVCETESVWVTDKKTAIDSHGRTVTILPVIQTQTGPLKQYFYETRCRRAEPQRDSAAGRSRGSRDASGAAGLTGQGVAGESCLGVDKKQWVSECKAKQSYVRALTKDANNRTGWRWIRLDSSCVCVLLSRVNRQWAGRA